MGFFDDALGSVGMALAQTASGYVQDVTGPQVGAMLGTLFGGGQTTGGANIEATQTAISQDVPSGVASQVLQGMLEAQSTQISDIGDRVASIATVTNQLLADVSEMAATLGKIAQEQLYLAWQQNDDFTTTAVTSVATSYQAYGETIQHYETAAPAEVTSQVDDILNNNDGPKVAINTINTYLLPDGQRKGLLQLWTEMVQPLVLSGQLDYRQAIDGYSAYYTQLVASQMLASNLLVEAHNYYSDGIAEAVWTDFQNLLGDQEDQFIAWLAPLIVAAQFAPSPFTGIDAAMHLQPDVAAMTSTQPNAGGYYEPSSIFSAAESMMAATAVTDPNARRIVVNMVFCDLGGGSEPLAKAEIDANPLTITAASSLTAENAGTVPASKISKFSVPLPGAICPSNENFDYLHTMYLYRHVYEWVGSPTAPPDGLYTLTNLNGVLPEIDSYAAQQGVYFQRDDVLGHALYVDGQAQADSMNFAAYMASLKSPSGGATS
jgi:hypothetical protein